MRTSQKRACHPTTTTAQVLGWTFGLLFLILQLPINYCAGSLLAWTATKVEQDWEQQDGAQPSGIQLVEESEEDGHGTSLEMTATTTTSAGTLNKQDGESNFVNTAHADGSATLETHTSTDSLENSSDDDDDEFQQQRIEQPLPRSSKPPPTVDLIEITTAVFDQHRLADTAQPNGFSHRDSRSNHHTARTIVLFLFYASSFLVLGDYILVMSHAVAAVFDDDICITTAGLIASTVMFAICQLNTMALIGQYVSLASLAAIVIVLLQCLWESSHQPTSSPHHDDDDGKESDDTPPSLLRRFSALASIFFAFGTQKVFLNIRYELKDKQRDATPMLARSLVIDGVAYLAVVLLAGSNPPSFLFDSIPEKTWNRRIAGFLLWGHVAVSYAINAQPLASSLQRMLLQTRSLSSASASLSLCSADRIQYLLITLVLAVSSYLVANGVPFFRTWWH